MGQRDVVSSKLWEERKNGRWPIRLVLNSKASNSMYFYTRYYSSRGLMQKLSGQELAQDIGVFEQELSDTLENYNSYANGDTEDPHGKKYFANAPLEISDTFHVALVEPVLHSTMGGIEVDEEAYVFRRTQSC